MTSAMVSFVRSAMAGVSAVFALLAELRAGASSGDGQAIVMLEQVIGAVRVGVRFRAGHAPFAEFDAPKRPEETPVTLAPVERIAAALGLIPTEIGFENHRPAVFSAGVPYVFAPIASLAAMEGMALWYRRRTQQAVPPAT